MTTDRAPDVKPAPVRVEECLDFLNRFQDANGKVNCTSMREGFAVLESDCSAIAACAYTSSEPHLSGYRLILGFDTLEEVHAAQQAAANCVSRSREKAK